VSPQTFRLLTAATHFVPAVLWGGIAYDIAIFIRRRRPQGALGWVLVLLASFTALHFATWTAMALLLEHLQGRTPLRGALMSVTDGSVLCILALARHVALVWPIGSPPPTRRWLAVNYGICGTAVLTAVGTDLFVFGIPGWQSYALYSIYLLVLGVALVSDFRRRAARGAWRPGGLWQARTADVVAIGAGLAVIALQQAIPAVLHTTPLALLLGRDPSAASLAMYVLNGASALLFAMPFVVRNLGDLLPGFVADLAATAAVAVLAVAARSIVAATGDAEIALVATVAAILVVVFVVMPARRWLQPTLGRVLFRRGRLRWAQLHRAIQTLPIEQGVTPCCRRLLGELVRVMRLRGAAIVLADGAVVRAGAIDVERVARVWPRDGALAEGTLTQASFRELPRDVADALTAADVLAVVAIASPRRRWGHVFVTTDLRGASFGDEDDAALGATADQLALALDAADLLVRAVEVERSLAHAEKLAAIGELAARFAHDIRNPVTAARSLAQQLARDPTAPENAEHAGIILEELERVERQVRDLLRFARREELRLEPTELGPLVRGVAADLAPRLDQAAIRVVLDTPPGVVARADREKMRHVVINLVENAADALATSPGERRLRLAVATEDGHARVTVDDSGPGVPPEALPRLFEPFFSLKPTGTGLGLAIARRTVEAHGGTIAAASAPGDGTRFTVTIPLGGPS
jgi:signal transduction histidine kinase